MKHAKLSPSRAETWMLCPASIKASEHIEEEVSQYALEGIAAHKDAAEYLKKRIVPEDEQLRAYASFVNELTNDAYMFIEQCVTIDLEEIITWGTADVIILKPTSAKVIDLKWGKGVRVSAKDNKQLKLYALGVLDLFSLSHDLEEIEIIIHQPRLGHISRETLTRNHLEYFRREVILAAKRTMEDDPQFIPGEKQCRWCAARHGCRYRAAWELSFALLKQEGELTVSELQEILPRLDGIRAWVKDVQKYALGLAQKGQKIPGWKLVKGITHRRWKEFAEEKLKEFGIPDEKLYQKKLVGIPAIEKIIGKEKIRELVYKPPGQLSLVPDEDRRSEVVSSAADDFKEDIS